jgi:hypothetical protein
MTDGDGVKYTLQVAEELDHEVESEPGTEPQEPTFERRTVWVDVWSGTVPSRTKALTVIRQAAAAAGLESSDVDPPRVRLLPGAVAEPFELLPPAPAPGPRQVRL